ncbi:hypothetical protein GCM10011491_16040 [Brucella endophytica]|uniref:Uncharacterized protein n=1 Tax=Brucella endophytica TaxID=1963359 RepID=A0A916WCN4_9HYPH|nr:hypothetical protein [Brucella endophytica]GGA89030.1 hypothetical protein GCM10011491_16040 [Brucella endophytica]
MEARRHIRQDNRIDFASILAEVERQPVAAPENPRPFSFDFLDALLHLAPACEGSRQPDFLLEEASQPEPDSPLPSTDPEEVARELQLSPDMSTAELTRVRRRFAALNHPDRVAASLRDRASDRMKIANALIDKALAGAPSREI